jgi:predicted small secreted protein
VKRALLIAVVALGYVWAGGQDVAHAAMAVVQ